MQFKNITIHVFEKSAHNPQQEEASHFDQVLQLWFASIEKIEESI
jgi:hypothetical protein